MPSPASSQPLLTNGMPDISVKAFQVAFKKMLYLEGEVCLGNLPVSRCDDELYGISFAFSGFDGRRRIRFDEEVMRIYDMFEWHEVFPEGY